MQLSFSEKVLGFKHSQDLTLVKLTLNKLATQQEKLQSDPSLAANLQNILQKINLITEGNEKAEHDHGSEDKAGQRTRSEKIKGRVEDHLPESGSLYCGKKRKGGFSEVYRPIDPSTLTLTQRAYYLRQDHLFSDMRRKEEDSEILPDHPLNENDTTEDIESVRRFGMELKCSNVKGNAGSGIIQDV
eukprot:CAMPEP_0205818428 /NCGR_PEP_ID=MMETSP0206-20130828/335_1 /ASSEMBLY_ACC=CAM_ASM_000279 /TAXON_ID=36767 /ORGANISM="Euplotes focardii, Strain TN1" /LENGTH=186 /DNA_ID=CAMNT_0053110781 /DNA_START=1 /DNA_END=562 /DNA_ORIENTATION=+